jgi:flagellar hook-length control protein FliK
MKKEVKKTMKLHNQTINLMNLLFGNIEKASGEKTGQTDVFDQIFANQTLSGTKLMKGTETGKEEGIAIENILEKTMEKILGALQQNQPIDEKEIASVLDELGIKGKLQTEMIEKITEFFKNESLTVSTETPVENKMINDLKEEKTTETKKEETEVAQAVEDLAKIVASLFVEIREKQTEPVHVTKNENTDITISTVTLTKPKEQEEIKELNEIKKLIKNVEKIENTMEPVKALENKIEKIEKVEKQEDIKVNTGITPETDVKTAVTEMSNLDIKTENTKTVSVQELKNFVSKELNTYVNLKTVTPKKIVIQLNPENLGKIEIQLEKKEDGTLVASFKVHESDTVEVVEKVMEEMKKELHEKGTNVDIEVTTTNDNQNKEEKRKEERETLTNHKKEMKEDEIFDEIWQEQLGG